MVWAAPSAVARLSLSSLDEVMIGGHAHGMGELQAEDRDAAGALQQHGLPGDQLGVHHHGVPRGDCGARQRRALLERQMRRDFDDAVLLQHGIFGEHAVDRAAERARLHILARLAARPALEEAARDLVADLHTGDARADLDHLAGAVGQRHDLVAHRHAVGAAHDAEVAEIERAGRHLDQHLAVLRFRLRQIDAGHRFDTGAAFRQLIGTHA